MSGLNGDGANRTSRSTLTRLAKAVRSAWQNLRQSLSRASIAPAEIVACTLTDRSLFEGLERRQLLSSVTFNNGVLTLTGDSGVTNTLAAYTTSGGSLMWGISDNTGRSASTSQVSSIVVNSGSASDKISIASQIAIPVTITGPAAPSGSSSTGATSFAPSSPPPPPPPPPPPVTVASPTSAAVKLTGTPFGTAGSWASSGMTYDKAFDGDTSNFFDAPTGDGDYTGLDLGTPANVSTIKYMPRLGFSGRMIGGQFQGSNDGVNYTTLATITSANWPVDNTWSSITVNSSTPNRYVRYLSPNAGYGNVAEIEFDGVPSTVSGGSTTSAGGTTSNSNAASPKAIINMVSTASIIAGQAIDVHAMDSSVGVGTPLTARYEWNFGDSSGKYNALVGFNAAHVYDTPGAYTLTLKITNEAGKVSMATRQITVAADARRTIYVDAQSGNDNNSGLSPDQPIQSVARANSMLADNTKILFKRGETFATGSSLYLTYNNVSVDAYGFGANPEILWTGGMWPGVTMIGTSTWSSSNVMVQNITFDAIPQWDGSVPQAIVAGGTNITVRGCTFLNVDDVVNANANPTGLLVQDNTEPTDNGLREYFVWLQGTDSTIIGNTCANSTRQHVIRASQGFSRTLIAYNNFDNKDRTALGDPGDNAKATINLQTGSYAYVASNHFADGPIGVGPLGGTDGMSLPNYQSLRTSWVVFEKNTIDSTSLNVTNGAEHIMVRNNVVHFDNNIEIKIDGYDSSLGRAVSDLTILNNTGINNGSQGKFLELFAGGDSQIKLDNNLYLAQTLVPGPYGTAAIYSNDSTMASFSEIKNNVWPMPNFIDGWANGGINWVATNSVGTNGYETPSLWNSWWSMVSGDSFQNVQPTISQSAVVNGVTVGANLN